MTFGLVSDQGLYGHSNYEIVELGRDPHPKWNHIGITSLDLYLMRRGIKGKLSSVLRKTILMSPIVLNHSPLAREPQSEDIVDSPTAPSKDHLPTNSLTTLLEPTTDLLNKSHDRAFEVITVDVFNNPDRSFLQGQRRPGSEIPSHFAGSVLCFISRWSGSISHFSPSGLDT
jgi:hypothetical protein